MGKRRKLHIFLFLLAGALVSVMLVMMRLGGSVNFQEFISAGRVYDVEPARLRMGSENWLYERENGGHRLLSDKAMISYRPSDTVQTWSFLYITVRELSKEPVNGILRYYDGENVKILEQPITLTQGRNMIQMDSTLPIRIFGIVILDAEGEFISISDIQIRTTPSWFTVPHFLELFAVALAGIYALMAVFLVIGRVLRAKMPGGGYGFRILRLLLETMQDVIKVFGDFLGKRMGGKLYPCQRESVRKFLFSLLIVWMMAGNAAGWLASRQMYRYHVLICALLLLFISFVSWEKPLRNIYWRGPLMKSWLLLWLGIILCDFFVVREMESIVGYAMFFAGSVFVYFWQNIEKPGRMLLDLLEALELTFFLGVGYCMVFRGKLPEVDYNGMFRSAEELAMYAVLMGLVFLADLDRVLGGRGGFASYVKDITGGAVSIFLLLRSGHLPGIVIFLLLSILYIPLLTRKLYKKSKNWRAVFLNVLAAAIFAYACTCLVFISTKYFPQLLGLDVQYEDELLVTRLEGEQRELYLMQFPQSLDGVRTKEAEKLPIIWRTYARRLNLFGHGGEQKVFRREIAPYNGYLKMAYQHGIFILLPYAAFQIMFAAYGVTRFFRKKGGKNIYLLFLGIVYPCFCFCTNVEISWGHPLWLSYYLSVGYLGMIETEKK